MEFTPQEIEELQRAKDILENPGLAARISNFVGEPIEKGFELLPDTWNKNIGDITQSALLKAAHTAIFTMRDTPGEGASNLWHKLGVAVSGGVGGFFGIPGLSLELPISTTIMLRSIADVARSEGECVNAVETKMACLEVFALGGKSSSDDGSESGYYVIRAALTRSVIEATEHLLHRGLSAEASPALIRLMARISERFGVQVTQKAAAQAIPALGAAGGALINTLFMDHFQDMARGHFIVRRLERQHGKDAVQALYESLGHEPS